MAQKSGIYQISWKLNHVERMSFHTKGHYLFMSLIKTTLKGHLPNILASGFGWIFSLGKFFIIHKISWESTRINKAFMRIHENHQTVVKNYIHRIHILLFCLCPCSLVGMHVHFSPISQYNKKMSFLHQSYWGFFV